MPFNSLEFIIFFPIVTLLYFLLPQRFRWLHLLLASSIFYMFFVPAYILILAFTIVVDYFAGLLIEPASGGKRKFFLVISLLTNILVLAVFKYYNFFNDDLAFAASLLNVRYALPVLSVLLPIGLSFHTFQAMSYTIEVYRGRQSAEKHLGIYALYVMFYPQLVAGPIERPQNLIHQFREHHKFDAERVSNGLKLMLWGMFKKIVIADRLAVTVDAVYNEPQRWGGAALILATVFFTYQIYCDFSGYSDIAIGAAEVMGFRLMRNFDRPFSSKSMAEFWRRWHISLSTWFRDYLYLPLGGNRTSRNRWHFNILLTFFISGLWHGANWTFVIFGLLNGLFILFSTATIGVRYWLIKLSGLERFPRLHAQLKILIVFCLFSYSLIFFRTNNFADAVYINRAIASTLIHPSHWWEAAQVMPVSRDQFILCLASIAFLEFVQSFQNLRERLDKISPWFRWALYYALILAIFFLGEFNSRQFIYFQF